MDAPRADLYGAGFRPFGPLVTHAELMRIEEPAPEMAPEIDERERWLARVFLRRYVTWCARAGHQDRAEAAAVLYRRVTP